MKTQQDTQTQPQKLKTWPNVAIIILNWNGWRDTIECLESIQRLDYPNYRIVVLDNASTDGSMEKIKAWSVGERAVESKFFTYDPSTKPVHWIEYDRTTAEGGGLPKLEAEFETLPFTRRMVLIQTGANLGYAGGNNVGIRYALKRKAEYIFILNNDTVLAETALTLMVKMMCEKLRAGCLNPKILYYEQPDILQVAGCRFSFWSGLAFMHGWRKKDNGCYDEPYMPGYLSGAALLCYHTVFKQVGLLDKSFFMYGEDVEWSMRVKKAGFELWYCPQAKVWHKENATVGYKSPFVEYLATRNCLKLVRRYYPWRMPVAIFFHLLRVARRFATANFRRGMAVLKGIWSGILNIWFK